MVYATAHPIEVYFSFKVVKAFVFLPVGRRVKIMMRWSTMLARPFLGGGGARFRSCLPRVESILDTLSGESADGTL